MEYEILVISGGGVRGIVQLGALYYFWNAGSLNLNHVKVFSGSSIGSAICLLLNCGYTPFEILRKILVKNFSVNNTQRQISILDIKKHWGLFSLNFVVSFLRDLILEKTRDMESPLFGFNRIPTLKELQNRTKQRLVITGTNITKMRIEYFSAETTPNLSCIDAVRISCSIPLLFHKVCYNGDQYVDGGYLDNFPVCYVDDKKTRLLGIVVTEKLQDTIESLSSYVYRLFITPLTTLRTTGLGENCHIVDIKTNNGAFIDNGLCIEEKFEMFKMGYRYAGLNDR